MTHEQEIHKSAASQPIEVAEPGRSLKFGHDSAFQRELRRRVEEHFRASGLVLSPHLLGESQIPWPEAHDGVSDSA
jgi:hypothetical protein